jgi:phosphoglycerate dehydrogenase-like enzyme
VNLLVLSTDASLRQHLEDALAPLGEQVALQFTDPKAPDDTLLAGADGVICGSFSPALREKCQRLRWVQFWSAGVDGKLFPALFAGNVTVCTGAGIHVDSCANHVLAMMLAFARSLPLAFEAQKVRDWSAERAIRKAQFELDGATLGIVGVGAIGSAIATRAKAFGMNVIGVRRHADRPVPPGFDAVIPHLQYHEMIVRASHVVLALPLTSGTRWLFGEDEIEVIPRGAYLYNIGRGGLIDEKYVQAALTHGWLAGAGLDVFEDEPLPETSPWWTTPNTILTPHVGGNTPNYWPRLAKIVAAQTGRLLAGQPLENAVDQNLGY